MRALPSAPTPPPFPIYSLPRLIPPSALPPFTSSSLSHPSHITHHDRIPSFWIHHPSSLNHRFTTPYMSPPPPSSQCVFPQPSLTPHPSSLRKSIIFPHPVFSIPTFIIGPSSRTSPSVIIQPSLLLTPLSSTPHSFRHPYFPSLSKITTQEFK